MLLSEEALPDVSGEIDRSPTGGYTIASQRPGPVRLEPDVRLKRRTTKDGDEALVLMDGSIYSYRHRDS